MNDEDREIPLPIFMAKVKEEAREAAIASLFKTKADQERFDQVKRYVKKTVQ